MFHSARLKLTAWYLLIITLICVLFSVAFYNVATQEIDRFIHRIQHMQQDPFDQLQFRPPPISIAELQDSEQRLLITLVLINLGILLVSGCAAYFLAGRTLKPIQQMVDEQNRFITDSSHELRTPLTALRAEMEASLLDDKLTIKDAKKVIGSNLEEVINLHALSDNLLQLSRFQQQKTLPLYKNISLLQVIEDALKKVTPLAKSKHIIIQNNIDDAELIGNQQQLTQLLVILLDNAIKYSHDKTTVALKSKKQDHHIAISVIDQGIGIEANDIPLIFDRFYRGDKSRTKTDTSGYGLGLSIAKKIVEEHNGSITVKSKIGKETVFTVSLPYG